MRAHRLQLVSGAVLDDRRPVPLQIGTLVTLVVIPALYLVWRRWQVRRQPETVVQETVRSELALARERSAVG